MVWSGALLAAAEVTVPVMYLLIFVLSSVLLVVLPYELIFCLR